MLKTYIVVMLGGGFGAVARVWLSLVIDTKWGEAFPFGTLAVNVSGCLLMGLFVALTEPEGILFVSPLVRQAIMLGVLGGYTTFSSFSLQTLVLLKENQVLPAFYNIAGSMAGCLIAVWIGFVWGNWLNAR